MHSSSQTFGSDSAGSHTTSKMIDVRFFFYGKLSDWLIVSLTGVWIMSKSRYFVIAFQVQYCTNVSSFYIVQFIIKPK